MASKAWELDQMRYEDLFDFPAPPFWKVTKIHLAIELTTFVSLGPIAHYLPPPKKIFQSALAETRCGNTLQKVSGDGEGAYGALDGFGLERGRRLLSHRQCFQTKRTTPAALPDDLHYHN